MTLIPDGEKLIGKYLRDSLTPIRVVGQPPPGDNRATPWIQLTLVDAANDPDIQPDYLITYHMQLDCYAGSTGGQPEAGSIGYQARGSLAELNGANQTLVAGTPAGSAVVSKVEFSNMARIPDDNGFEPARERIVLDTLVTMHAVM